MCILCTKYLVGILGCGSLKGRMICIIPVYQIIVKRNRQNILKASLEGLHCRPIVELKKIGINTYINPLKPS